MIGREGQAKETEEATIVARTRQLATPSARFMSGQCEGRPALDQFRCTVVHMYDPPSSLSR